MNGIPANVYRTRHSLPSIRSDRSQGYCFRLELLCDWLHPKSVWNFAILGKIIRKLRTALVLFKKHCASEKFRWFLLFSFRFASTLQLSCIDLNIGNVCAHERTNKSHLFKLNRFNDGLFRFEMVRNRNNELMNGFLIQKMRFSLCKIYPHTHILPVQVRSAAFIVFQARWEISGSNESKHIYLDDSTNVPKKSSHFRISTS